MCDDYWDDDDALVVCHQLGFFGTAAAVRGTQFGVGSSTQPIWLDDLRCTGRENYLSDCPNPGWAVQNCLHYEDAGVVCEGTSLTLTHSLTHSLPLLLKVLSLPFLFV